MHGDATGEAISTALLRRVAEAGIQLRARTTVVDVVLDGGRAVGVRLLDGTELSADAVILATGGAGQLYRHTTNPEVATGDGVAIALRAGAAVADLEFYQFHPTSLAAPGQLLDLRGRPRGGGHADRRRGPRFMLDVHPAAELAPRDVVARGIADQMARSSRAPRSGWTRPSRAGLPGPAVPHHRRQLPSPGLRLGRRPDPGHPGRALLDGWGPDRRLGRVPRCPVCTRSARSPAPACTAPTGWPPTRCSRVWSTAVGSPRPSQREPVAPAEFARGMAGPGTDGPQRRRGRGAVQPVRSAGPDVGVGRSPPDRRRTARGTGHAPRLAYAGGHRRQGHRGREPAARGPGGDRQRPAADGVARRPLPRRLPRHRPRPGRPLRVWCLAR